MFNLKEYSMIVVDTTRLEPNVIIWYRLPPRQLPKNRLKLWRGKVLSKGLSSVFVESLQEGYEGQTEYVAFDDIVFIEIQADVPGGVPAKVVQDITENCRTLKKEDSKTGYPE
jgi:hypothetical protein